jgi:hypothetical protein
MFLLEIENATGQLNAEFKSGEWENYLFDLYNSIMD